MNKIIVCYQDIEGGQKQISESLISSLRKHSKSVVNLSVPSFTNKNARNYIHSIILEAFFWKAKFDSADLSKSVIICTWYRQFFGLALSDLKKKYILYYHGDEKFDLNVLQNKYKKNLIKKWYAFFVNNLIWFLQKIAFSRAQIVIVPNTNAKQYLSQTYHVPLNKIEIVPNWVDSDIFYSVTQTQKNKLKKQFGFLTNDKIITFVGRIDYKKGIEELITAFDFLLANRQKNYYLNIIFPSLDKKQKIYLNNVLKKVSSHTRSRIRLIKQPKQIEQHYQMSSCAILPSKEEIMPLTMLEALACGTPFVGSKTGNIPYILKKIDNRLLLESIQPIKIASKIEQVLNFDNQTLKEISLKEIKTAKQLTFKKIYPKLITVFNRFSN